MQPKLIRSQEKFMAYDIFISYRRKGAGAGVAGELQAKLENLGYKVFLDVDKIGSGQFPTQIKQAITECKDFLLVLSPGTLDRCVDEEDWVRREIILAQEMNKNIVGIGLPGFIMPEEDALPAPLKSLATRQVFLWTHEYRAASFEKIAENLVSTKLKKKKKRQTLFFVLPVVLVLAVVGVLLLPKNSAEAVTSVEEPLKEEDNLYAETQKFEFHANKAMVLTQNLPDVVEIKKLLSQSALDVESLTHLMEGIAEYDEALRLKEKYGDQIIDSYGVEAKKKALLDLRESYFDAIVSDINTMILEGGAMFASQDLEMAKVLAMPEDQHVIDSLEIIIR